MFNGRVLLLRRGAIADGTLSGAYLETDFASFIAWRDWGFPDKTMRNCFPMAALRSSDGAYLLGVMGGHTATAGQVYFPAGTPDPNDIVGESVDLEAGVMRELAEETGLGPADATAAARLVRDAARPAARPDEGGRGTPGCRHAAAAHRWRFSPPTRSRSSVTSRSSARSQTCIPRMPPYVSAFLADRLRVNP
jgi:8-oxo-dGTP pyrophosphatase MutT (NUDIX family)